MEKKGIDVSKHQGIIDWNKIHQSGKVEFVMIRAGFGKNNLDNQFIRNIKECNRLGIPCGVYWFSYALNSEMAAEEAQYCLNAIKDYKVDYPVCYDLEYDTVTNAAKSGIIINKSLATAFATAFTNKISSGGYLPMLYSNSDYCKNMFDMTALAHLDLWYARYRDALDRKDAEIWQYSSDGQIDGINGKVDVNISYKDYLKNETPGVSPEKPTTDSSADDQKEWLKELQKAVLVKPDGIFGPLTLNACPTLQAGDKGAIVNLLQKKLIMEGSTSGSSGADGIFGSGTKNAVLNFQRKNNLSADGVVGKNTWSKLITI